MVDLQRRCGGCRGPDQLGSVRIAAVCSGKELIAALPPRAHGRDSLLGASEALVGIDCTGCEPSISFVHARAGTAVKSYLKGMPEKRVGYHLVFGHWRTRHASDQTYIRKDLEGVVQVLAGLITNKEAEKVLISLVDALSIVMELARSAPVDQIYSAYNIIGMTPYISPEEAEEELYASLLSKGGLVGAVHFGIPASLHHVSSALIRLAPPEQLAASRGEELQATLSAAGEAEALAGIVCTDTCQLPDKA